MATKQMNVKSDGFHPGTLTVNPNQDSVHFVQSGTGAPSEVTISSGNLFVGDTTTCQVDPDTSGTHIYQVQSTASGAYAVDLPPSPKRTKSTGTISVT